MSYQERIATKELDERFVESMVKRARASSKRLTELSNTHPDRMFDDVPRTLPVP